MLEDIKLAIQGIVSHKLRSLLTMLGVIIGIASIITIVSTIKGTNEQIKESVIGSGTNSVVVRLYQDDYPYESDNGSPEGVTEISEETRLALEDISGADGASLFHSRDYSYEVFFGTKGFNGGLYGIDSHYFAVNGYKLCYGRGLLQSDLDDHMQVCFLDSSAVNNLLTGRDPIGEAIEIRGVPFVVVGVVDKKSASKAVINSINDYYAFSENNSSGKVFIPDSAWPIIYGFDEPLCASVKASDTDSMTKVGKRAADILTKNHITGSNPALSYRSVDLLEQAEQLQELSSSNNRMLLWIASISLLVGGIGVMNIMLVSVTERTGEIGLKKAIGAKKKRILFQFLTEAGVLTGLGGLMGVIVGIIMSLLMSNITGAPSKISVGAIIIAVVFSTVIGVVFGMIPAVKAANLNPIEALRRD